MATAVGHLDHNASTDVVVTLNLGCDPRRNTSGFVLGNWRYPYNKVTMSILIDIRAIRVAASMLNWLLCRVVWATTSLGNDVWWQRRQYRRNRTRRQVSLHDGTLRNDRSWQPPLSYGRHEALLLAPKNTTISQHIGNRFVFFKQGNIVNYVY
jgi:hypothetical protein